MTDCETTRQQLLDLPASRFVELSAHLDRCPACRALADRILDLEAHVSDYVEQHAHAETFDAALTAARPPARARWVMTGALALAAAATLALAVWSTRPPESSTDPSVAPAVAEEEDLEEEEVRRDLPNLVSLGYGRSTVLELDRAALQVSVVDPGIANVSTVGTAERLQVQARRPGRTMLHVVLDDGSERSWWIRVEDDPTLDPSSEAEGFVDLDGEALTILVGERGRVSLPSTPTAIAITDPGLVNVVTVGRASELGIDGRRPGTTDILVQLGPDRPPLQYVVTVEE